MPGMTVTGSIGSIIIGTAVNEVTIKAVSRIKRECFMAIRVGC